MKTLALILYYSIASKLPNYAFPLGKLFNYIRYRLLKCIIDVGSGTRIQRRVYIGNGNNVTIGSNCRINENIRLDNVEIGNNVMIARDTVILGKQHGMENVNVPMVNQRIINKEKTIVEDDVWIGLRVIIMPGICIKKGSIIGAGAVVTKSTSEKGIYAGVPARLIRTRE